jgi:hypothetical protein
MARGVLESAFDRYEAVTGVISTRLRTDHKATERRRISPDVMRRLAVFENSSDYGLGKTGDRDGQGAAREFR